MEFGRPCAIKPSVHSYAGVMDQTSFIGCHCLFWVWRKLDRQTVWQAEKPKLDLDFEL